MTLRRVVRTLSLLAAVAAVAAAAALAQDGGGTPVEPPPPLGPPEQEPPPEGEPPDPPPAEDPPIAWRRSRAAGKPWAGRLVRGVRLPSEGRDFLTWDPILRRSPNRPWRRWGTDRLLRLVLRVAREHREAFPDSPRLAIGDLSRPRGGDFGERFGGIGHASHQNGLDADVYYPRLDRAEARPRRVSQVDRELAQDLVDRLSAARIAKYVFVGPNVGLSGPRKRVQRLVNHDDHLHLRIRPRRPAR